MEGSRCADFAGFLSVDLDLTVSFGYFVNSDCKLTPFRVAFAAWLAFAFGFLDFEAPPKLK